MSVPEFNTSILRKPESLMKQINDTPGDMADACRILLTSSASNDYLEKIAVESIGARHLSAKLGADGIMHDNKEVEAKPRKSKTPNTSAGGVINDDTPMKLKKSYESDQFIVFLNANKESRVNWAVVTHMKYWNNVRYAKIVSRLKLNEKNWTWPLTKLPDDPAACLADLVSRHVKDTYVRSSPINLSMLEDIPADDRRIWIHPDLPKKSLPKILQKLFF